MAVRSLTRYEDEFDREARMQSEARVVNVSPHVARWEIATTPGSPARKYRLAPGESIHLQVGYTREFQGAGRQPVRPTIEALTERQTFPGGPSLPMVVSVDRAEEVAEQWEHALARSKMPAPPVKVMVPRADGGEPVEMLVASPPPTPFAVDRDEPVPMRRAPVEDDEDQDGPLDEPPPDDNEPLPTELPPASARK